MIKSIFTEAKRMSFCLITNTAYQLFNTEYIKKITLKFSHAFFSNIIAPDKQRYSHRYFLYFSMKTYVVDTHEKCLGKALLMNPHNICFCGEMENVSSFWLKKSAFSRV